MINRTSIYKKIHKDWREENGQSRGFTRSRQYAQRLVHTDEKKRDISGSIEMKDDIDKAIEKMEEDHDVLLYYQMLDFRLRLLLEDISQSSTENWRPSVFKTKIQKVRTTS